MTLLHRTIISAIVTFMPFMALSASDRDLMGLKGPVESVRVDFNSGGLEWSNFYRFSGDGNLTVVDDEPFTVERDVAGRIVKFTLTEEDEDGAPQSIVTEIAYSSDGRVESTTNASLEEEWTDTYTYGSDGNVVRRDYRNPVESESFTYSYTADRDSHGNWLQRTEKSSSVPESIEQKRTITYYSTEK